jgi:hypothetical protein
MLSSILFSFEYKFNGFVFDYEDGWKQTKGSDPSSVFKIEKNTSYIEFLKMEDELSDFYLNSMISKQKESLFSKGLKPSEIKTASIHGTSKAYYFYYTDSKINIVSLFTYGGVSYSLICSGVSEESFKNLIYKFRKEGEKIEIPIAKPRPKPKPKVIAKKEEEIRVGFISVRDSTETVESKSVSTPTVSSSPPTYKEVSVITSVEESEMEFTQNLKEERKNWISAFVESSRGKKPLIKRKPINKYLTLFVIAIYLVVAVILKAKFSAYSNPKANPYPKDMPPDFVFPIMITRVRMLKETLYQIITRTNQFLSSHFNHSYRSFYNIGVGAVIFIHLMWSLSEFIKRDFFALLVLSLPFGGYILSFIELPFLVLILYGLYLKHKEKEVLVIMDSQTNLITKTMNEKGCLVIKNSKDITVMKVLRKGSFLRRMWVCYDEDDREIMVIKDDYPLIWFFVKLFGNKLMNLRCYYSLYVENEKRIGFLYLDPNSKDGYQIHYDYDYFRLVNPMYVVSILLYIISKYREESIIFI